ncbi:aminodeoxychorismate synthase, component I [Stutzerimonas decontaminans]|uniref:aminodeoxychorismate synthase n=2 Tax=Stutzerimonas TaxID=2901164 RepID=A0ABX4VWZ5_9GAMM|nr:aminodeoxychorismate synthase component I [Stutzerimonas decontaminans]AHY43122.1 aminodeoxychorismate synthase [Stutzerimonas decontaminans]MCQ4246728.1 aminodeoxychorismate synthase component I [Stutzerimonas decontaminans]PNF83841.1 aminodeoxychorismate synthase, component I [Stutzerimonas decontaminans]
MPICTLHALPYQADPAHWFERIRHAPGAVLLDSGRPKAERGRFDILSAWPVRMLEPGEDESGRDFFHRLRQALGELGEAVLPGDCELPFAGGLIGFLSYDFGSRLETLPQHAEDDSGLPLARFGLYAWALITDHQRQTSQLLFHPAAADSERNRLISLFDPAAVGESAPFKLLGRFTADLTVNAYRYGIERIQAYIQAGDCYQVNFTQRFRADCSGDPWTAYCALRKACPTPYASFLALDDGAIASLSPERFLRLHQGHVETRPIKGTRPRGKDERSDAAQAQALLASDKDRAENLMIVDLLRNDLGRSCRVGSVRVPELFALESYPNVHHLVSCVTGELADGQDALDLLAGSFPGGSITGAPKIRAMQIIDELEPTRRAIYCGSLLYIDIRGEMDSSIAIRTLLIRNGQASCWGGGGIVADSDWQAEYQESIDKVKLLLETLEQLPD